MNEKKLKKTKRAHYIKIWQKKCTVIKDLDHKRDAFMKHPTQKFRFSYELNEKF